MSHFPQQSHSLEQAIDNAVQHHQEGRFADAEQAYRKAITIKPDYAALYINLGNVLYERGCLEDAAISYRQALAIEPKNAVAYRNLGNVCYVRGCQDEAAAAYRQATICKADYPEAHCGLANTLYNIGKLEEAAEAYRQAIAYKPDYEEAYNNLGKVFMELGRLEEAVAACRQAVAHEHDFSMAHSNLLLIQQYIFSISPKEAFDEACNFGKHFEQQFRENWNKYINSNNPDKRLRVGLVSGDLGTHPVGYFLETVVQHVNRKNIALFAYANQTSFDALSERIRPYFQEWVAVKNMSDDELAVHIRADEIDILIDLAGHTKNNRLPMFALKPAPVQVTWLGYPNTTGLHAIDYILADPVTAPVEEEPFYTEKIWRLPETYICFTPPETDISINPLPALKNGYVTFGSFNNPAKINDTVIACWVEILRGIPNTMLLLKNGHLDNEPARKTLLQRCMNAGIDRNRVHIEGGEPSRNDLLASYHRIDISLDPFPYSGTTTTCESIWMGVPALTLKMSRGLYSHSGELIMGAIGHPNWVAESVEEYVEKALEFATDLQLLAQIRAGLRDRLLASPLCDAPRFAHNLESALRGMWQQWCNQQQSDCQHEAEQLTTHRKLHIGGTTRSENWELFSINEGAHVDHVGNALDLSRFSDNTFAEIYASHVLEHFDFKGELLEALTEWHRVLQPGGVLSVSVPDLDVLAKLYLDKTKHTLSDRFFLMSMIFGGHADKHDYHHVGLNEELLSHCLRLAGFVDIRKVTGFGIFEDTSGLKFKEQPISLNMVAHKGYVK